MNFSRKMIFVVGAAFLAACGDKVTVAGPVTPVTPTPKINSVEVAPLTATLNVGQTITMTAAVNADAGLATTVTWSSSDATKASVSTAGVVTAVAATPGVAICAASTVDTGKKGCASVVVTAAPVAIPATISIQSITGAAGLNAPVNPAAVAGQIDVTLNVNPGNQVITKVELLVGGAVAGSQTFTAAQSAALRFSADEAVAAQTTFPQIVFSVNTAAFAAATGVPSWLNGAQGVSARLYTTAGGSATAATASATQTLTFANANAFAATTTVGGTTATANNATGFRYTKGDLTVSLIPVSYSGVAFASGTVNFGTLACDGSVGAVARTKALAASGSAWAATFANSGAAGAANLTNYSFNSAACAGANSLGEQFSIVAAQDASGNPFTTTALPINVGSGYRIDNYAPGAPTLNFTIASRRNALNWINDLPALNDLAANGGAISVAAVDLGVGGVGFSTTATNVYKTTVGGNVIATAAGLAESINNTAYSATAKAEDLLGNASVASGAALFGVDRTAPSFTAAALPADASVIAAPGGVATGAFAYTDPATAPAGPSTPSATPVRVTISKRTTATATSYTTGAAWGAVGGAAASYSIGLAGGFIDAIATNTEAYYVVTAFVEDGAANASASITRTYLYDVTAPAGPFTIPVMTTSAGSSNLFTSSITDNLDIASSQWQMEYGVLSAAPGAASAALRLPATTIGSFLSFTTAATSSANYPLYRSMIVTAAGYVAGAGQGLLTVGHQVVDRGTNTLAFAATAVPAVNLPAAATADPLATAIASGFAYAGFVVSNAAIAGGGLLDVSGNGVAPNVNTLTLTATATGTVNTMINPFVRVEFWTYDAGTNSYRYLGQTATPSVVDNAVNRVYTWTFAGWDPDSYMVPTPAVGTPIIAIGVTSTNDAVRSAANVAINTQP